MLFRDTVNLIAVTISRNAQGQKTEATTSKTVYANKKSVRQSEHYQAKNAGTRVDQVFEIRNIEFGGETRLQHNSINYEIERTYTKNEEIIELYCKQIVIA
jgi:SPP1 family predicted phage head-tail adaptor